MSCIGTFAACFSPLTRDIAAHTHKLVVILSRGRLAAESKDPHHVGCIMQHQGISATHLKPLSFRAEGRICSCRRN